MMDATSEIACLAARAREGDQIALNQLLDQHQGLLFAVAYRKLGDYADAQDCVAVTLPVLCLRRATCAVASRQRTAAPS